MHPCRKLRKQMPMDARGAGQLAAEITHGSSTIRMSTTPKISTVTNTIAAATACIIGIRLKCRSPSTIASGTIIIRRIDRTTGGIISSWTFSKIICPAWVFIRGYSIEFIPAHRMRRNVHAVFLFVKPWPKTKLSEVPQSDRSQD